MKEKKGRRLWGPMKGEPNERGQTDDRPNLIEKPVAAREERGGKGRKKREGEKGGNKGAPSYDTSVQGHIIKEGLPAMTKAFSSYSPAICNRWSVGRQQLDFWPLSVL